MLADGTRAVCKYSSSIVVCKVATPLRELTCHMGSPSRGDISALPPAEAGTRLSDPGGMQG